MSDSCKPPQDENGAAPGRDSTQEELARLRAELDRVQRALAAVTAERDCYHRSLLILTRENVSFTEEDLRASEESGLILADVIREIEEMPENEHV